VIHALGILLCLPHILRPGEVIDYVSLGAGNTGRAFDLETSLRVAEFKFIHGQGGPGSIRQNSLACKSPSAAMGERLRTVFAGTAIYLRCLGREDLLCAKLSPFAIAV
jgi:hypothetical protein